MVPSVSWNVYQGLLASVAGAGAASFFEGAASVLDARSGFEGASAFLRNVSQLATEPLMRRAALFLGRRDLAAALMPHAEALARAAGLNPASLETLGQTRPERLTPIPWWFEAKHPPRSGRGMVPMEAGALAVGDERALDWLLKVRDLAEQGLQPSGFSAAPHLIWIPDLETQALELNVRRGVHHQDLQAWENVNEPGRIKIRALFPYRLKPSHRLSAAAMALTTFQHQFWSRTPEGLETRFGTDLVTRLPDRAIIHQHHFAHPQMLLMPNFGRLLRAKTALRIVFLQAGRIWAAQLVESGTKDRTAELPEGILAYFQRLNGVPITNPDTAAPMKELPDEKAERVLVASGRRLSVELDQTQPLSVPQLEGLRTEMRLPYDDTSPGIPALSPEEVPTRPARGLLELLGRIFTRRSKEPPEGSD